MNEIRDLEMETFVQATEDSEKVVKAINNILPPEMRADGNNFTMQSVRGVFHNPITIIRVRYSQEARKIIEYFAHHLSESDKRYLFQTLNRRIDKSNLYLRFGKQELYQGRIEIKEIRDIVKVRVGFTRKFSSQAKMTRILEEMELIIS